MRLAWILAVVAAALVAAWIVRFDDASTEKAMAARAETAQRFKDWAFIARSKALSPTEELSLVVIPSEIDRAFDLRCIIYTNRAVNQTAFVCPEATQAQLGEVVERER
jgi:hypothetical protein